MSHLSIKKYLCVLILAAFFNSTSIHAQSYQSIINSGASGFDAYMNATGRTFNQVVDTLQALLDPNDTDEDGGAKRLKEFKAKWEGRAMINDASGDNMFESYLKGLVTSKHSYVPCYRPGEFCGNWTCIGPDGLSTQQVGYTTAIWVSPVDTDFILVGTLGGLFKKIPGGNNWVNITDFSAEIHGYVQINNIAVNPLNYNHIYIGTTGGGLLKSFDGGAHWSREYVAPIGYSDDLLTPKKIYFRPDTLRLYALVGNKIFTCLNDAYTTTHDWQDITPSGNNRGYSWKDFVFKPGDQNQFFASNRRAGNNTYYGEDATYQGVWHATDSLASSCNNINRSIHFPTDVLKGTTITDTGWAFMALSMPDNDTLFFIAYSRNERASLFKYSVSADHFTLIYNNLPYLREDYMVGKGELVVSNASSAHANIYYGWDVPFHSTDRGDHFTQIGNYDGTPTHGDIRAAFLQHSTTSVNGKDDRVYFCTDGGISIKPSGVDDIVTGTTSCKDITGKGLLCGTFNGFYTSEAGLGLGGMMHNGIASYEPDKTPKWKIIQNGDSWTTTFDLSNPLQGYGFNGFGNALLYNTTSGSGRDMDAMSSAIQPLDPTGFGPPIGTDYNGTIFCGEHHLYQRTSGALSYSDLTSLGFPGGFGGDHDPNFIGAVEFSPYASSFTGYVLYYNARKIYYRNTSLFSGVNVTADVPGVGKDRPINAIITDPVNTERIWASVSAHQDSGYYSVCYSFDHGTTWYNVSSGLPHSYAPVTKMVYDEGTNIVYAGTDVGVYIADFNSFNSSATTVINGIPFNSSVQWKCFNAGSSGYFPYIPITKLVVNHCQNKLYASTDGRSVWSTDLTDPATFAEPSYISVTGTETWNSPTDKYVQGSVSVKAGATLTIRNITVHMPKNGVIAVEPGGRLTVENATITNECADCMWQGIQARGIATESQDPDPIQRQGVVIINNSTIEHAIVGVSNGNTRVEWASNGGIIQATGSTFLNCDTSACFNGYSNYHYRTDHKLFPNRSVFSNCTFKIDNHYKGYSMGLPMKCMVYMRAVEGIRYQGCQFLNRFSLWPYFGLGEGIHAENSAFTVYSYCYAPAHTIGICTYPQWSRFCGLTYGINIQNRRDFSLYIGIDRAEFDSCSIGEYINFFPGVKTTRCRFKIGHGNDIDSAKSMSFLGCHQNVGIMTRNTSQTWIEQNDFIGKPNGYTDWYNFGTVIANSGGASISNIINNKYDTLTLGVVTIGNNRHTYDPDSGGHLNFGLQVECNAFIKNENDIYIDKDSEPYEQGINMLNLKHATTGNTFTASTTNVSNYAWHSFDYYYNGTTPTTDLPNTPTPKKVFPISGGTKSCPVYAPYSDEYYGPPISGTAAARATFYSDKPILDRLTATYKGLMDFGSTSTLLGIIDTATHASSLYSLLSSGAPYISAKAVKAASSKLLLSYSQVFNLMTQNPDNANEEMFVASIDADYGFLPADMDTILALPRPHRATARTAIVDSIEIMHADATAAANIVVMGFRSSYNPAQEVSDTDGTLICTDTANIYYGIDSNRYYAGLDSLDTWLQKIGGMESYYERAGYYHFIGRRGKTDSMLDALDTLLPSATEAPADRATYNSHMALWSVYKGAEDDGRSMYHLTDAEVASFGVDGEAISSFNTAELVMRETVRVTDPSFDFYPGGRLCMAIAYRFEKPGRSDTGGDLLVPITSNTKFAVYPNPSSGLVTFAYNIPNGGNSFKIVITNILGEKITTILPDNTIGKTLWDPKNIAAGVYIYEATDDKGFVNKGKLILIGK